MIYSQQAPKNTDDITLNLIQKIVENVSYPALKRGIAHTSDASAHVTFKRGTHIRRKKSAVNYCFHMYCPRNLFRWG
jgi:hypothetical protein